MSPRERALMEMREQVALEFERVRDELREIDAAIASERFHRIAALDASTATRLRAEEEARRRVAAEAAERRHKVAYEARLRAAMAKLGNPPCPSLPVGDREED